MAVSRQHLTIEQFLCLPEEKPALEFDHGEITSKVSPKNRHSWLQGYLAAELNAASQSGRLWRAFVEQRVTFGGRSVVPDVTVVRRERIPIGPDGIMLDDFDAPPDVAIEILSPGQSVSRTVRRCLWYVDSGVSAALLVDPDDRIVFAFRPGAMPAVFDGPEPIDFGDALPGFAISAQRLFDSLALD